MGQYLARDDFGLAEEFGPVETNPRFALGWGSLVADLAGIVDDLVSGFYCALHLSLTFCIKRSGLRLACFLILALYRACRLVLTYVSMYCGLVMLL